MQKFFTFENGLRLVVNTLNDFPSVVCSVHINTGSVNESVDKSGISHFLEHMTFKSTKYHTATEIASLFESIGAVTNAYTSKEETCFYFKSVYTEVEKSCLLLGEILFDGNFDEKEFETEKGVILEEINMSNDDYSSLCLDKAIEAYYENKSLANSILGSKESVSNLITKDLIEYKNNYYKAGNVVISFAGKISFEKAKEMVEKYFNRFEKSNLKINKNIKKCDLTKFKVDSTIKKTEQLNVAITYKGYNYFDKRKYAINLLSFIIGGGMSSRLFENFREKQGLVYSIFSFMDSFLYSGNFIIYFATNKENLEKTIDVLNIEIDKLIKNGITEEELKKAKNFAINTMILSRENLSSIAKSSARQILMSNKTYSVNKFIKYTNAVTLEDINKIILDVFKNHFVVSVVGKKCNLKVFDKLKK